MFTQINKRLTKGFQGSVWEKFFGVQTFLKALLKSHYSMVADPART